MKKKILIVDDHEDFRQVVKDYLDHRLEIEIFEACTGEMGVTKASCVKPDIVLMDLNLPNITGLEAARRIQEDHPACAVIILTVFDVPIFKNAADKINARDFIGKSEIFDRLLPAIKKCLETSKAQG